jgi:putative ABC transport system permease protein
VSVAALLILIVAAINFVNLMTAQAVRRGAEVGVRKAFGARRRDLIVQFMGEAMLYAALAMVAATALAEWALPGMDAILLRHIDFAYWRSPIALLGLGAAVIVLGLLIGAYPALVLSAMRPATVLRGAAPQATGSGRVRRGLVVLQFAVLIGLILATAVIWRQMRFVLDEGLRLKKDQVLTIAASPCRGAFADEVRKLPGVMGAACSSPQPLGMSDINDQINGLDTEAERPGAPHVTLGLGLTDFGFFELYGIKPLAGRLFARDHPGDELPPMQRGVHRRGSIVLNESAARSGSCPTSPSICCMDRRRPPPI